MGKDIGRVLKDVRKQKSLSVEFVSQYLIKKGFKASLKTVYSWENGNSVPTPEIFLSLCELYNIQNVLDTFGYKQSVPSVTDFEYEYIQKIRALNSESRNFVLSIIDREYDRKKEQLPHSSK